MDKIVSGASIDVIVPSPPQVLPAVGISEYDCFGRTGPALIVEIGCLIDKKSRTAGSPIALIETQLFG